MKPKLLIDKPIVYNFQNFQEGISISHVLGNKNMRNCDIWTDPGVIKADFQLNNEKDNPLSLTFTADAGTDLITAASTLERNFGGTLVNFVGRAVQFTTTGTLPAGLALNTTYFLSNATGNSTTQARIATTLALANAGTPDVNITDSGTGIHTITTINMGLIKHYVNSTGIFSGISIIGLDENGRVWIRRSNWQLLDGNTRTAGTGQGLALWKNYIFVLRATAIDVCGNGGPTGITSANWTNGWNTTIFVADGAAEHKTLVAQDDILYFANKPGSSLAIYNSIGSISEIGTFIPSDVTTYNFNTSALDLPDYKYINDLEEFNGKIHIATNGVEIYPWDNANGATSFDTPIQSPEKGVSCLKTFNSILYFAAGSRGNMYKTMGTTVQMALEFADEVSDIPRNTISIYDIEIYQGFLIFVVNSVSTASDSFSPCTGVYMLDPDTGVYFLKNRSTLGYGDPNANITLSRIYSDSTSSVSYYVSAKSASTTTIETTSGIFSPQRQQTYSVFRTKKEQVGTYQFPRKLSKIELFTLDVLNENESVSIYVTATTLTGGQNETITFTEAEMEGKLTQSKTINIIDAFTLDLTITINPAPTVGTDALYDTPSIREIIIT